MTQRKLELIVEESSELRCSPGDFGEVANEVEGVLYLPSQVYKLFEVGLGGITNIRRTPELVDCIINSPTAFKLIQKDLGWADQEFKRAEEKLMQTLRQYVPDDFFDQEPQPPRVYGALPTQIQQLMAEPSSQLTYTKGDFGAKVEGRKLLLPGELYAGLTNNGNFRSAEEIVAIFEHFPSYPRTVAEQLGWSEEEVRTAYQAFVALVRPYVDSQLFEKRKPLVRRPGVRKPPALATQEAYVDVLREQLKKEKH